MKKIFIKAITIVTLLSFVLTLTSAYAQDELTDNFWASYSFGVDSSKDISEGGLKFIQPEASLEKCDADEESEYGVKFKLPTPTYSFDLNNDTLDYDSEATALNKSNITWDSEGNFRVAEYPQFLYQDGEGDWIGANTDRLWTVVDTDDDGITDSIFTTAYYTSAEKTETKANAGSINMGFGTNLLPVSECENLILSFKFKGNIRKVTCFTCQETGEHTEHSVTSVDIENLGAESAPQASGFLRSGPDADGWYTATLNCNFTRSTSSDKAIKDASIRIQANSRTIYIKDISVKKQYDLEKKYAASYVSLEDATSAFTSKYYVEAKEETVDGALYFNASEVTDKPSTPLYVTVKYFDNGTEPLKVGYISYEDGTVSYKEIARSGTEEWMEETIKIDEAYLNQYFEDYDANISIMSGGTDTYISSVTVSNTEQPNPGESEDDEEIEDEEPETESKKYFTASYTFGSSLEEDISTGGLDYSPAGLTLEECEASSDTLNCGWKGIAGEISSYEFNPANIHYVDGSTASFDSSEQNIIFRGQPSVTYNSDEERWESINSGDTSWGVYDEDGDGNIESVVACTFYPANGTGNKQGKPRIIFNGNLFPDSAATQEIVFTFKYKGNFKANNTSAVTTEGTVNMDDEEQTVFLTTDIGNGWKQMVIRAEFKKPTTSYSDSDAALFMCSNGTVYMKDIIAMTAVEYDRMNSSEAVNHTLHEGETAAFTTKFYSETAGITSDGVLYFDASSVTFEETAPLYVKLRYFDNGTEPIKIAYISSKNGTVSYKEVVRENTQQWCDATVMIEKAYLQSKFDSRNTNIAILSSGQDTYIHSIEITNASEEEKEILESFDDDFIVTVEETSVNSSGYIIDNFTLPAEYNGCDVEWSSADESVIEIDGSTAIIHSSVDGTREGVLTAKITSGLAYVEKIFTFTLAKTPKKSPIISNVSVTNNGATATVSGQVYDAYNMGIVSLIAVAKDAQGAIIDKQTDSFDTAVSSNDTLSVTVNTPNGEKVSHYFVTENKSSLINAAPSPAENFTASTSNDNLDNLEVSWKGSADDFDNVTEYQFTANGYGVNENLVISSDSGLVDDNGHMTYSKTFDNLTPGDAYTFSLKAKDHAGEFSPLQKIVVSLPKSVSVDFTGDEIAYDGMMFQITDNMASDAYSKATEIDGVNCRQTASIAQLNPNNWRSKLHFAVDKDIIPESQNNIIFEVTYFDNFSSDKSISIGYNNNSNGNSSVSLAKGTSSNKWKTATIMVTDACLSNSKYAGKLGDNMDFRITTDVGNNVVYVSKVRVAPAPVVKESDTGAGAVLERLGLMGNIDPAMQFNRENVLELVSAASGKLISPNNDVASPDTTINVGDILEIYLSYLGVNPGKDILSTAKEYGLIFESDDITNSNVALTLPIFAKVAYNALFAESENCTESILSRLITIGRINESTLISANDPKCEAYRYKSGKKVEKQILTDAESGREYYWMDLDGESAIRNYFNKQEWNSDSTKFIFGNDVNGAMYEYNVDTQIVRFLDFATSNGSLSAVVSPTDEIFYQKENGDIWRINWNTYEKKLIAKIPAPYTNFGNISVTNDGKYLSCMVRKVVGSNSFSGPLVLINVETGVVDTTYTHNFSVSYDGIGHPIINPVNKDLLFFCHEGDASQVDDRMWILDRTTGEKTSLPQAQDETIGHESWGADGSDLYFVKYKSGDEAAGLCKIDIRTGMRNNFTSENDEYSYWHCHPSYNENWIVADTNSAPRELVIVSTEDGRSNLLAKFRVGPSVQHPYQPHPSFSQNDKYVSWGMCDADNNLGIAWMNVEDFTK